MHHGITKTFFLHPITVISTIYSTYSALISREYFREYFGFFRVPVFGVVSPGFPRTGNNWSMTCEAESGTCKDWSRT